MHGGETILTDATRTHVNAGDYTKEYKLSRILGKGAFAKVRVGIHKVTREKWAVKIVDRASLGKEDAAALGAEVDTMIRVHHPNIVHLKEVFDAPNEFVMVLELCTGGELFDRVVDHHHYSEKEAAHAFAQMNEAIGHCHEHGIVHRDLKPENLLYAAPEPCDTLKLADFGFAAVLSPSALLTTQCGTPGYVAPEVLRSKKKGHEEGYLAKPVDVWSLGVILYILLCGFPPFYHENNAELFKMIKRGEFTFPSPYWDEISDSAKALISGILVVDTAARLTCEQIVDHPWLREESPTVHLPHFASSMKAYNARRRFRGAVKAVVLAMHMQHRATQDAAPDGDAAKPASDAVSESTGVVAPERETKVRFAAA